jgi:hypothetical protein
MELVDFADLRSTGYCAGDRPSHLIFGEPPEAEVHHAPVQTGHAHGETSILLGVLSFSYVRYTAKALSCT